MEFLSTPPLTGQEVMYILLIAVNVLVLGLCLGYRILSRSEDEVLEEFLTRKPYNKNTWEHLVEEYPPLEELTYLVQSN